MGVHVESLVWTNQHWLLLSPYLVVFFAACVAMLVGTAAESFKPKKVVPIICGLGLIGGLWCSLSLAIAEPKVLFNGMMVSDPLAHFSNVVYCILGLLVLVSSVDYLEKQHLRYVEFDVLILFSVLGMMLMTSTQHLVVMFVALELMSLSVYVLVGFRRSDRRSNEAGVKYYILGSAASAILLYGVALTYGMTGSFNLIEVLSRIQSQSALLSPVMILGALLLITGFLFKTATVPFHMWMPDVYEGAPLPITSFMTTALKFAVFVAFIRVLIGLDFNVSGVEVFSLTLEKVFWLCAALTMFAGNLIALMQTNIKRMLAYSSIAHTGYLLVGLLAGLIIPSSYSAVIFYLVVYALMNVGAFTILAVLAGPGDTGTSLEDVTGLAYRRPKLSLALAVFLFSMAGIPPTGGFFSKYLLFYSGVQAGATSLVLIGVLCSAISVYYYLRVIVFMFMRTSTSTIDIHAGHGHEDIVPTVSGAGAFQLNATPIGIKAAIATTLFLVLALGVVPMALLDVVQYLFLK